MGVLDITVVDTGSAPAAAVTARGVFAGEELPGGASERLRLVGFEAKPGQVELVEAADGTVEALVGLGKRDTVRVPTLRQAAGALVATVRRADAVVTSLADDVSGTVEPADAVEAITLGALDRHYRFTAHRKPDPADRLASLVLTVGGADDPAIHERLARSLVLARAAALCRDLVNEPGGTLTAPELARRLVGLARETIAVEVLDHDRIRELGMGGLLGVNRGSVQPPAFVIARYMPRRPNGRHLAFVGKGITYDTGGINLKRKPGSLKAMKTDMGGVAAIAGALVALDELDVATQVTAYLPLTDNMTGGDATRPGDVLRMFGGTTVEVVDTDAEGRLVLGDAVAYACADGTFDAIVDVATLTGTAIHATGTEHAALITGDDRLAEQIMAASARSGERVWRLPRVPEYRFLLNSSVADMTNNPEAPLSTSFAALFVETFADDTPFAHLDIAAVVARDRDTPAGPAGATGYGPRLLVALAETFTPLAHEDATP